MTSRREAFYNSDRRNYSQIQIAEMLMQLQMRIEKIRHRLDRLAAEQSTYSPDCICFPEACGSAVGFPILKDIAFCVKCPRHGDRFVQSGFMYVSEWMRGKLYRVSTTRESSFMRWRKRPEKHIKAYLASFPPDLFPGDEEREIVTKGHSKIFLHLRDGTRIQVSEDHYYAPHDTPPDPDIVKAYDMQWRLETLRTLARLLSKRGLTIEPSWLWQET
jgi:hypothetical protein